MFIFRIRNLLCLSNDTTISYILKHINNDYLSSLLVTFYYQYAINSICSKQEYESIVNSFFRYINCKYKDFLELDVRLYNNNIKKLFQSYGLNLLIINQYNFQTKQYYSNIFIPLNIYQLMQYYYEKIDTNKCLMYI